MKEYLVAQLRAGKAAMIKYRKKTKIRKNGNG